jgi:dTDP-4-amino-4,6-dideoxygalactose transaminase
MSTSRDTSISSVPLLDISRENAPLATEIEHAVQNVIRSGRFVLGPEVQDLETAVAQYSHTKHAIGCASGSDALLLALMAMGISPGDEVIVPSFTFFATASAVWRLGARPVFVDIDPDTFNLDPSHLELLITNQTRAIIPVHLFGQCADMQPILEIASRHNIKVIEDSAQSIGAEYKGQAAGSLGLAGCLSFYPTKNLGGFGDAGMLTTNDDAFADEIKLLRGHGMRPRYLHQAVGINSRLDTIQAVVLLIKLRHLRDWTNARRHNAQRYHELFEAADLGNELKLPYESTSCTSAWNQYTIQVADGRRDALREFLKQRNIGSEIYYPLPLHLQPCFAELGIPRGSLPVTERAADCVLSLPIFPHMTEAEQDYVVSAVAEFFKSTPQPATNHALRGPNYLKRQNQPAPKA